MRRFDWSGYDGHVPELVAERDALRAIVEALPRCDCCDSKATQESRDGSWRIAIRCDEHPFERGGHDFPYAEALRAYEALK
jgi:hypothetical protein